MRKFSAVLMAILPAVAFAADAPAPATADAAGSQFASIMPLLFIFVIFYFLLIRPQQKRMKEHQAMLTALVKGDEVVTAGGIVGRVTKIEAEDKLLVEIAKGVEVAVVRSTISAVLGKTAPVVTEKKKGNNKNDNSLVSRENIANDN